MMRNLFFSILLLFLTVNIGFSQIFPCESIIIPVELENLNVVTLVPFLNLPPNPQSSGLGYSGIAIAPSNTSLILNSSNLAFIDSKMGVQVSYAPWLKRLGLPDVYLVNSAFYYKLDKKSTIGASFRYFNLGSIDFTNVLSYFRPREWEGLLSYNRAISTNFSMGLSLKYIHSHLVNGRTVTGDLLRPLNTAAGDISFTYRKPLTRADKKNTLIAGLAIRNIGPKGTYFEEPCFLNNLPANLGLGVGFIHEFQENHTLTVNGELNRLLVPSPSEENVKGDPAILDYQEKSVFQGMISSFADAPGGLGDDFKENKYSLGLEYRYKFIIARIGHFNEHKSQGIRKLLTYGIGFRTKGFSFDLSHVTNLNDTRSNAESWRVALSYDLEPVKKQPILKE